MSRKILITILFLSAASLIFALPQPVMIVCGFIQSFYIPGLAFMAFLWSRKRSWLDEVFLPPLISPILLSVLLLGIYKITGSFHTSMKLSALIFYCVLLIALLRGLLNSTGEEYPVPHSIFCVSLTFSAVIAAAYIVNYYLLFYTDAWHHISVVNEILDRGIPPMDPRLPDLPIRYMWFYHLFHAAWKELSGLKTEVALGIFNIVNAFVFPYLFAKLVSLFTNRRLIIVTSSVFACAGLQSAGWVLWPLELVRAFFGEVRGSEEIARTVSRISLNDADVIYFLTPVKTWLMNLQDKFITITAINVTFNLFLLCFIVVIASAKVKNHHIRAGIALCLIMLGAMLFHVVEGMILIFTAIGGSVLIVLVERIRKRSKPSAFLFPVVPVFAILAAVIGMPYFISLTAGGGGGNFLQKYIQFGYSNILTIMAPLIALFPFSKRALKKIFTTDNIEFKIAAAWIVSLVVISQFADLPGVSENKVVFPLFLLLSPFIAWQIVDSLRAQSGIRRVLLYIWIFILFLVPPVLTVRGFMLERPKVPEYIRRIHLSDGEREVFDWIRHNTDINAVIIEKNLFQQMPVHARRRNFYLQPGYIYVHGYGGKEVERYGAIHEELFSDEPIGSETIDFLRRKNINFYIVLWQDDLETDPQLNEKFLGHPEWFDKAFENSSGKIYHLKKN
jgi:hypothetical protein